MAGGETLTVTFKAQIDALRRPDDWNQEIINTGKVTALGGTVAILAVDPLYDSIGDFVWLDLDGVGVQDGGAETDIGGVNLSLHLDANNSIIDGGDINRYQDNGLQQRLSLYRPIGGQLHYRR